MRRPAWRGPAVGGLERRDADRGGVPTDGDRCGRRGHSAVRNRCGGTRVDASPGVRPRARRRPDAHAPWRGPYNVDTTFHEPFVMFGYLAGCTWLELVTGVIILPQRQTALVAKQAAEVDLLTEGRFRLGVGIGWNAVEYEALGVPFGDRGRRMSEQIPLLRRLISERAVSHDGEFDRIMGAGLGPCLSSVRSRSGSAASPRPPLDASADSPTAGSPRFRRAPSSTRRGDHRRSRDRGGTRSGDVGHGGPGQLVQRRRRQGRRSHRPLARRRRDPRLDQHDERRARPSRRHLEVLAEVAAALSPPATF